MGSNWGVYLTGSTTDVTSVDGDVSITGTGGNGSGDDNPGVSLESDSVVQVTTGALHVSGTTGAGNSSGVRLSDSDGGRLVSIGSGSITITADGVPGTQPDFVSHRHDDSFIGGTTR